MRGVLLLILLIVGAITAYATVTPSEFDLTSGCDSSLDSAGSTFSIKVKNEGVSDSQVCIHSDDVTFKESQTHSICYSESKNTFDVGLIFPEQHPDDLTLKITSSCNAKFLGIFPAKCDGFTRTCIYKKGEPNIAKSVGSPTF